jgi:hypothetical protein
MGTDGLFLSENSIGTLKAHLVFLLHFSCSDGTLVLSKSIYHNKYSNGAVFKPTKAGDEVKHRLLSTASLQARLY